MIIDMHSHVISPTAGERIKANPQDYGAKIEEGPRGTTIQFDDSMPGGVPMAGPLWANLTDTVRRVEHLTEIGADGAVVSTHVLIHRYGLPSEKSLNLCRVLNDGIAEMIRGEDTLKGMATLPLHDGAAASLELVRCVEELGLIGATLVTNLEDGRNLDDPGLEPLWETAEAMGQPLFLHPSYPAGADRLKSWGLENLIGFPLDVTIAAASLVLSGVIDRHPNLKVILGSGGGYFPTGFGRMGYGYHHNPQSTGSVAKDPPEAYLRRFYYDTLLYHPAPLMHLVSLVGAERIMLGTDYPLMEPADPVRSIEALDLAAGESEKILGNAADIFGFVKAPVSP